MAYTDINDPTDHFRIVLYNGNNNPQNIVWNETDTNMQPDLLWIKSRSGNTVFNHVIGNVISDEEYYLHPNTTGAEVNNGNVIASFNSNGFSVGGATFVSEGSRTYVAWGWKGNGSGASNEDGSIDSTVSVNTTSGCGVVAWNGNDGTVGHGLGVKPAVIIIKSRQTVNNWVVFHKGLGTMSASTDSILVLNTTTAKDDPGSGFSEPTTSVFTIKGGAASNDNNIALVFAEKQGFSKFGSYTGNNNANGPFVYLGFRPAWVLIKDTGSTQHWHLVDSKRDVGNDGDAQQLSPNSDDSEAEVKSGRGTLPIDLLSNGFKISTDGSSCNGTGEFIYFAFAESPFVNSEGIPNNAR